MPTKANPPSKEPHRKEGVTLDIRYSPFPKVLFCNRFHIEKIGDHVFLAFGLLSASSETLDAYGLVVTGADLEMQRANWLDYLGKLGMPTAPHHRFAGWNPSANQLRGVETANFFRFGRVGPVAEFRFFVFPITRMMDFKDLTPEKQEIETVPLALIRCDLDLQIHFLMTLLGPDALEHS